MTTEPTIERVTTAGASAPAVRMTGIVKRFPGVIANNGVDFELRVGEVHALLGENGAGKSTLSNILTGLYRPDSGTVEVAGTEVHFKSPRDALAAGIGMVHQHFRLVEPFTVAENIVLGDPALGSIIDHRTIDDRVRALSEQFGLPVDPTARIWQLSVGEQQRVEIVKMLYRNANVLILDEPTAVLPPGEAEALFETMRAMAAAGQSVIFISHKLDEVMTVSDRVTVLRDAKSIGTVQTVDTSVAKLAQLMVGREVVFTRERIPQHFGERNVLLDVRGLTVDDDRGGTAVDDVSFELHAGEILGIAGVSGNGQRELAEAIAGIRSPRSGVIEVDRKLLKADNARDAKAAGVAYVPEDRMHVGLAASLPIEENLVLKSYRKRPIAIGPMLRRRAIRSNAVDLIERFDVKCPSPATSTRVLSGGNVQKVLLAREFTAGPKVLIASSPTRGLDIGSIETVRGYLLAASADGIGILLISEDLEEVMALSDRIAVLFEGRIVGVVDAEGVDVAQLGLMMGGRTDSATTGTEPATTGTESGT